MGEEKREPQPGYWAVIPAQIRYDDAIPADAKLIYAEISSLIGADGYCWATNDYFAGVFKFTDRTVRRLLGSLSEAGYIRIEEQRGQHKVLRSRRIFAAVNPLAGVGDEDFFSDKIVQRESDEKFFSDKIVRSSDKIVQRHIIKIPSNITKESPRQTPRTLPQVLPERFEAFWKFYRAIPGEGGLPRNEKRAEAVKAWDKLQPDDALIDRIGRALQKQLRTADWRKGVGIPMAATYLNQRRWEDAEELPEAEELLSPADGPNAPTPVGKDVVWV